MATPGLALSPALIATIGALALVRPVPERLPLFPIWPGEAWALSAAIWWGVLILSTPALLVPLAPPPCPRAASYPHLSLPPTDPPSATRAP